ncbi:MAG TPA: HIRAN domain-containing protein [Solirubrobacteraceae bacterium]|nr:HIRAN domain-containing protein [Solirubrobacteraceae bacterium]
MSRDLTLDAIVDDGRFTGDDGSAWWAGGYQLVDSSTGRFLARDAPELDRIGVLVTRVAGAGFKHEALQGDQFSPGRPLRLRPDPDNEHDPDAVGVWDAEGRAQAGWIPRQLAPRVAGSFRAGQPLGALVLREFRRESRRGERVNLSILVAPVGSLTLRLDQDVDEDDIAVDIA